MKTCSVDDCDSRAVARGFCMHHYHQWRSEHPEYVPEHPSAIDRIFSRLARDGDCWIYTGGTNGSGYGHINIDGHKHYTHRVVYEHLVGSIPDGLELDHLCRHPACCNPSHLEPVTHSINGLRGKSGWGMNGGKCDRGHNITDTANVYVRQDGRRECRTCRNEGWVRNYWIRKTESQQPTI